MPGRAYALLTPARNEADLIERPLESVVRQTLRPVRWIILSDGSTDGTDAIVRRYAARYDFIELMRLEDTGTRDFRSKVRAVQHGYDAIRPMELDYIGNLDADVSFEPAYYGKIMQRMEDDPRLGIAGGVKYDLCDGVPRRVPNARDSVGGPVQFFRRACWDAVGGYAPARHGGEDTAAEITARMKGWRVESFPDLKVLHHRETGTAQQNRYGARFEEGLKAYLLGYHPLFFIARSIYRIPQPPRVLGALLAGLGYLHATATRQERDVSDALVAYLRKEQLGKLGLRWSRSAV